MNSNLEAIKKLKVAIHEKEVTLKTTHGQIAKHQKQLNESGSKKEYEALQTEIAAARAKCSQLEEESLTAMGESEERTAKIPELEKAAKAAKEAFAQYEKDSGAHLASLKKQHDETLAKAKEVEATVPANVPRISTGSSRARGPTPSRRWWTAVAAPAGRKSSPSSTTNC